MGSGTDALKAAIDAAWRVFDLPAPATTGVCVGCCMDPAIEADFLQRKARDLPADYVRDWYFAAYAKGIGHDHIAWFLPRVMEMLAAGEDIASVGHEVAFQRLPLTGFPDLWSKTEVAVLDAFAAAFFAALLDDRIPYGLSDLDSWLCMFGEGHIGIDPLLAQLEALPDDRLVAFLHTNWVHRGHKEIAVSPFWADSPARRQVWDWYTSPRLLAWMERAALAGDPNAFDLQDLIAAAQDDCAP